jgi:hypothetical protein
MSFTYQQLQSMGATPGTAGSASSPTPPSSTSQPAKKTGLSYQQLQSMGATPGVASAPSASPATPPQSMGQKILGGAKAVGNFLFPVAKDMYNDYTGQNTGANAKTSLQQTGDLALSILPFIPGLGEVGEVAKGTEAMGAGAEAVADTAKSSGLLSKAADFVKGSPVAKGAITGYGAGVASNLSQGGSLGSAFMPNINTVGGAVLGGGTAGLLKGIGIGGNGSIADSATEDMNKVLNPTTKVNKAITQSISPELASKGIIASSRESLLGKYQGNMQAAGEALEEGYQKLPQNAKFEVTNLFQNLNDKIDSLKVNGVVPSAAQDKVNALTKMTQDLANIGLTTSPDGTGVFSDVDNVRQLRQIIDSNIRKGFSFTDLDTAANSARKELANSIRSEFANQYPDIAKLNKNYSFWSKASSVLEDTIERKTGQSGIVRKGIAAGVGAMGGLAEGHPIIGAAVMKTLSDFVDSPAWLTTSALIKSKLASALESGDSGAIGNIVKTGLKTVPTLASRVAQPVFNTLGGLIQK